MTRIIREKGYRRKGMSKQLLRRISQIILTLKQRETVISTAYKSQEGSLGKGNKERNEL